MKLTSRQAARAESVKSFIWALSIGASASLAVACGAVVSAALVPQGGAAFWMLGALIACLAWSPAMALVGVFWIALALVLGSLR